MAITKKISSNKTKTIFISHSSKDFAVVDKLQDLLQTGCDITSRDTICTTLVGLDIPIGTENWVKFLQEGLRDAKLVILILSENYMDSEVCLCELGAAWALGIKTIPLVLPPLKRSRLKAILPVTQAGYIIESETLDELRDSLKNEIGAEAPTPRWSTKRDQFLKTIPDILSKLTKPTTVEYEKFTELQATYQESLSVLESKDAEIQTLNQKIADISKLKDLKQVRKVTAKYTNVSERFEELCEEVQKGLRKVYAATQKCLFQYMRGEIYFPDGDDQWSEINEALSRKEIVEDSDTGYVCNRDHKRVQIALASLKNLREFLGSENVEGSLDDPPDFPIDMENKDFWQAYLVSVD